MKRIYHHYKKWEDYKNGMYRRVDKRQYDEMLKIAINFTGNHIVYGQAMLKVIKRWKFSCEHNLSNVNINRKAWLGHAACALEINIPEYIVRAAWAHLSNEQRFLANKQAEMYIKKWEQDRLKTNQLSLW